MLLKKSWQNKINILNLILDTLFMTMKTQNEKKSQNDLRIDPKARETIRKQTEKGSKKTIKK